MVKRFFLFGLLSSILSIYNVSLVSSQNTGEPNSIILVGELNMGTGLRSGSDAVSVDVFGDNYGSVCGYCKTGSGISQANMAGLHGSPRQSPGLPVRTGKAFLSKKARQSKNKSKVREIPLNQLVKALQRLR